MVRALALLLAVTVLAGCSTVNLSAAFRGWCRHADNCTVHDAP